MHTSGREVKIKNVVTNVVFKAEGEIKWIILQDQ